MHQSITSFAIIFQSIFGQILPSISYHAQAPIRPDPIVHVAQIKIEPIKKYAVSEFKAPEPVAVVPVPPSPPPAPIVQSSTVNVAQSGCGDNFYANYIYTHESGCSLTIRNAEGCIGIGQACPASKLLIVCPNLDYACENSFFTAYAIAAYGGWAGAYSFWLGHQWW